MSNTSPPLSGHPVYFSNGKCSTYPDYFTYIRVSVCGAAFGYDGSACSECADGDYKANVGNTDCSTAPDNSVVNGEKTDFGKTQCFSSSVVLLFVYQMGPFFMQFQAQDIRNTCFDIPQNADFIQTNLQDVYKQT